MATWEDGPEYAPATRPDQFEAPTHAVSLAAPEPRPAEPEIPANQPSDYDVEAQKPLAELENIVEETRDPEQPFALVSTPAAPSGHQFGQQEDFDPHRPFQLSSTALVSSSTTPAGPSAAPPPFAPPAFPPPAYPAPGTPGWFAPGSYVAPPPPKFTWGEWFSAMNPGVVLSLGLGMLLPFLAMIGLITGLLFCRMSRFKRPLTAVFCAIGGLWLLLAVVTFVNLQTPNPWYFDGADWLGGMSHFAQAACGLILVVGGWVIAGRLRQGVND